MSPDIQVGRTGVIIAGDNMGWQVRVDGDFKSTGGFLVIISRDFSDPSAEVFDDWVEGEVTLQEYFRKSGWVVRWL